MPERLIPPPADVLRRWSMLDGATLRPYGSGLINATFLAEGVRGRVIVQRLHPAFGAAVHEDIRAVTAHLRRRGRSTTELLATDDGCLWVEHGEQIWRCLSFVSGHAHVRVHSTDLAREAGQLVGHFHAAVVDLAHDYHFVRPGVHDTTAHLQKLEQALRAHRAHRLHGAVAEVAASVLASAAARPDFSSLPIRHAHGDLKISNLLFDEGGKGLCLVDLDTLGRLPWPIELGDAFRSWCNPGGEDEGKIAFDMQLFAAALRGYAHVAGHLWTEAERAALVDGVATIALELSARFLADALVENYFGWDPQRFAGRGEHNLHRARGQLLLHQDVLRKRGEAERVVVDAFR